MMYVADGKMGHSSKKHSHHGRTSYGSHHRAHGKGKHESHGGRAARTTPGYDGFGFASASAAPGPFGGAPRPIGNLGSAGSGEAGHGASTGDKVARLVLAAFALFEAARAFYGENPRPHARPVRRPATSAPVRISVCTGRSCARRSDPLSPADEMRRAAAASGQAVTVVASPCMKMCEQGPVVAASGAAGERVFVNVRRPEFAGLIAAASGRGR